MSNFSYTLSKKEGDPVFLVKGGKDSNTKFRLTTIEKGKPLKEYETNGKLVPIPGKERTVDLICGMSGVGKSTLAAEIVRQFKKKYPNYPFYLISPKTDDATINKLNPNRINITFDNFLGDDPLSLEEVEDSIILFDDCESIPDKTLMKAVDNFRDQCLVRGRSLNINVLIIMHVPQSGHATRVVLAECKRIVVFPRGGQVYQITNLLKNYVGLSKDQIKEILAQQSRYVIIHKQSPNYYMGEHKFKLLV